MGTFLDIALAQKNKIMFEPEMISSVCQSSGLTSVGTLLLEEYLISEVDTASTSPKRRHEESSENDYWVHLTE